MCKRVLWLRVCRLTERIWKFFKSDVFLGFVLGFAVGFYLFAIVTIWEGARSRFYGELYTGVVHKPITRAKLVPSDYEAILCGETAVTFDPVPPDFEEKE